MTEFVINLVAALALTAGLKLAVLLCGHYVTWRLALAVALIVVFTA